MMTAVDCLELVMDDLHLVARNASQEEAARMFRVVNACHKYLRRYIIHAVDMKAFGLRATRQRVYATNALLGEIHAWRFAPRPGTEAYERMVLGLLQVEKLFAFILTSHLLSKSEDLLLRAAMLELAKLIDPNALRDRVEVAA